MKGENGKLIRTIIQGGAVGIAVLLILVMAFLGRFILTEFTKSIDRNTQVVGSLEKAVQASINQNQQFIEIINAAR